MYNLMYLMLSDVNGLDLDDDEEVGVGEGGYISCQQRNNK
jgi:hypothetical protein